MPAILGLDPCIPQRIGDAPREMGMETAGWWGNWVEKGELGGEVMKFQEEIRGLVPSELFPPGLGLEQRDFGREERKGMAPNAKHSSSSYSTIIIVLIE